MIDSAQQRLNMVESQIRPSDVTDRRILRAMADVERERFVPGPVASLAYMDEPVPLDATTKPGGSARTLMPPRTFAKLVQLARIEPTDTVLVVGAGRGYSVAVVARLAKQVVGLEVDEAMATAARAALSGVATASIVTGPLTDAPSGGVKFAEGPMLAGGALFDVIVVEGAVWEQPTRLTSRLTPGGRLVGVLNRGSVGQATVWTRVGDHVAELAAFDAFAGVLPGFERPMSFAL